ncbi:MAG: glycosyltransferase family 2 protein [Spirochaetes bacterium]|nr:glycosyltransferase family 2 protein [Spirochaetota bacterium]
MVKVSVVIPAHNEERYIGDCLAAVLREARRAPFEVEVIVVDNASVDATGAAAAQFHGVRVARELRKGLSMARHRGYLESSGELIVNLDADTRMPRGYLSTVVQGFERDPRMVCFTGPFTYYDLPALPKIASMVFYLFQFLPNIVGQRILRLGAVAQGGNFVVRRSALDRVGGYDTSIEFYGEDTDIATRLSKVGLVRFSFRLPMRTSGRRLRTEGTFKSGYLAAMNIIFVLFYGRPLTRGHRSASKAVPPLFAAGAREPRVQL